MLRTRIFPMIFCLLSALLLCQPLQARQAEQETVILQLKWLHQFQFAGYYAALEKGFFADEGLKVELRERDLSQNNVAQVLDGEAHYGVADSILLLYHAQGEGVVLIAPILQHSPNVLMVMRSSGIEGPRDLIGKRLAFYDNDSEGIGILAMLSAQGVLRDGLERVPFSERVERLLGGQVDAITAYSTNEPFRFREQGHEVDLIDPKHFGFDLYGDILFTSEAEATHHPERVEAMRRAVLRGWEYALENKEELVDLILDKYNTQDKSRAALLNEALGLEQLIAPYTVELGSINKGRLEHILKTLLAHDLLEVTSDRALSSLVFESSRQRELALSTEQQAYLDSISPIRFAIDPSWPPFEYLDNQQQLQGVAADYLRLIGERLGVEFELVTGLTWSQALEAARDGRVDLLPSISSTPERRQYLQFTYPHIRSPMVVVTRDDQEYMADISALDGRDVLVVRDYASDEWLRSHHPQVSLQYVSTAEEGLRALAAGQGFAFVDNLAVISHLIKTQGLNNLQVSGQTPYSFDLSMAVRRDLPQLRELLDHALLSISQQQHNEIYDRWVSLPVPVGRQIPWDTLIPIGGAIVTAMLLLALHSMRLSALNTRIRAVNDQLQMTQAELKLKNEQLHEISVTDKLTGVFNRHHLDQVLAEQHAHAQRYQRPLSLVLFDLDYFKQVNDRYGHQAGDQVLRVFCDLVCACTRSTDIFGRWGGEEFLLVCPETTAEDALRVAEKIRTALAAHAFEQGFVQHVSAGIMSLLPGMNLDQLISATDQRLYAAKNGGRNRVVAN